MIIKGLLELIYNIMDLMLIIELPSLPDSVLTFINDIFGYMEVGAGILAVYTPLGLLLTMFGVLLAIDAGIMIYHFVMWVIKKIPMIGVS